MTNVKAAGYYKLNSFTIYSFDRQKSVDIRLLIHQFEITESIYAGSVRGFATVYDSSDLVRNFPLQGEEYIEISYEDFFGKEHKDCMFLYSVEDIQYAKDTNQDFMQYTIKFVSVGRMFSEQYKIRKAYNTGLISDYVEDIHEEYYQRPLIEYGLDPKSINVETTSGNSSYVIPGLIPEHAMYFMSRRAYSDSSTSQTFRFYENRNEYRFWTNEYSYQQNMGLVDFGLSSVKNILDKAKSLVRGKDYKGKEIGLGDILLYNSKPTIHAENQEEFMNTIIDINFSSKVNTINDINKGGYKRRVWEIDLLNNIPISKDYTHEGLHRDDFVERIMDKPREKYVISDYSLFNNMYGPALRDNQNYGELYNVKNAELYHQKRNAITATVYGKNNRVAGDVITIYAYTRDKDGSIIDDDERSGSYMMLTINNKFYENTYTQNLILSKVEQ